MSPVPAPKCQHEGCQNPTWYGLCHHHQSGSSSQQNTPSVVAAPPVPTMNFLHYATVSDLWSDLLGAFPDAGDVVQPKTIRQEALDTLSAAVDNEAYRRFPDLDVADYDQREALVAQMREQLVHDLVPEASHVSGSEARELSYSSTDQYGRSAEDSRYLASFALNAEWECLRIMGYREDMSFEQFVQNAAPDMQEAIDVAFRRNLGSFTDIIRQVTQRDPLNPNPVAPHLVIAPIANAVPKYDVVPGQLVGEPVDEVTDWFNTNRKYIQENSPAVAPPQPNHQPAVHYDQGYEQYPQHVQQQQQNAAPAQPESILGQLFRRGMEKAKDYVDDPDGIHSANRLAARQQREAAARQKQKLEDERIDRELKKQLLIQRKRRNGSW